MADLVLPDRASLEDWGSDIPEPGPGHQIIGFQQPVINPLSELDPRSFPDILLSIASDLGVQDNLPWNKYEDLLKESGEQLFALNRGSVTAGSANEFWNRLLAQGGWWDENSTGPTDVPPPRWPVVQPGQQEFRAAVRWGRRLHPNSLLPQYPVGRQKCPPALVASHPRPPNHDCLAVLGGDERTTTPGCLGWLKGTWSGSSPMRVRSRCRCT